MKPEWIKYTGSDEQIEEINNGFIFRDVNGEQCNLIKKGRDFVSNEHLKNYLEFCKCAEILICQPHQYAKEIQQWSLTGQPVW